MAQVRFENVTKRYGDTIALRSLNLTIADHEFLSLVGPSGSGKSTALRMISGLEDISEGNIYIGDQLVNNVPPKNRNIAMVFQSYALYPHMSVFDNLAFGLSLRKVPKPEIITKVDEAARILGIEDLLKRKPRQLSGGQRQRVALGRAIVREPAVFLLDEPLSNLDAKLRIQTRSELTKLHQRLKTTFIYVTHDQIEAMSMADRIAVLDKGELQQVGSPAELYDYPANRFVAGFIGSPAMNFFEGSVIEKEGETFLDSKDILLRIPPGRIAALMPYKGKQIVFGLRPEDIHARQFLPSGISDLNPVSGKIDLIEQLGNELILYIRKGDSQFVARVDKRSESRPGQEIDLVFNTERLYIFKPDTGKTIAGKMTNFRD